MQNMFADRMNKTDKSFIREILKVTEQPDVISFAGGLPNPELFPVQEFSEAASKVFQEEGKSALQYATTEGFLPLRECISERYANKAGLKIDPDEILIVNGSQQGIDLVCKVFLNKGDRVLIERPGYLGAIQAISLFEPEFHTIQLAEDGLDIKMLEDELNQHTIPLFYSVPNFQNPSGITYSLEKRKAVAELLKKYSVVLLEDDPYGDLRFFGDMQPPIKLFLGDRGVLMGSFSKITAPGFRLGWVCAVKEIMEKLKIVKQASDLHSNNIAQRIMHQYLLDNDLEEHIEQIRVKYKNQCNLMVSMLEQFCPPEVQFIRPEGGMFLWATLPNGFSSLELFEEAIKKNVAFVPGSAFHLDSMGDNSFRLNFSNSDETKIEEGIKRLSEAIKKLLG